jgi:hypothetical protein
MMRDAAELDQGNLELPFLKEQTDPERNEPPGKTEGKTFLPGLQANRQLEVRHRNS